MLLSPSSWNSSVAVRLGASSYAVRSVPLAMIASMPPPATSFESPDRKIVDGPKVTASSI